MQNRTFWRNSKQKRPSTLLVVFKYLLLIPATPAICLFLIMPHRRYRYGDDYSHLYDEIIAEPTLFLILTLSAGFLLWLWTVRAQTKATFELSESGLEYCGYGFFNSKISFGSIKTIKPYRIFPFGTLIDMQSKIGSNVRFFAFVARVKKPELREFLKSTTIEVK